MVSESWTVLKKSLEPYKETVQETTTVCVTCIPRLGPPLSVLQRANERQDAECVERHGERVSLSHSLSAEQQCGGTIEKQGSGSSVGVEQEATSTWPKVSDIPQGCLPVKRVEGVRCIDKQNTPTFAFVFIEEVVHRVDRRFNASFQTEA